MQKIYSSASKIVFISMALALIIFTGMKIISGEMFFTALGMVFGYYFKGQTQVSQNVV